MYIKIGIGDAVIKALLLIGFIDPLIEVKPVVVVGVVVVVVVVESYSPDIRVRKTAPVGNSCPN